MSHRSSASPLLIDFETCSPLDLKKVGIYRYTEDPRTFVRCFAAKQGKRQHYQLGDFHEIPTWLADALADDDVPLHAHNATVERLIISRIMGPRHGWPVPRRSRWHCSAARARRLALPGALDKLGPALGLGDELLKDKEGKRLIQRLSKPTKRTPDGFVYDNDPVKLDRFGQYCLQDVIAEEAAEDHTLPMPETEQGYYHLTERINDRGVRVDVPLVRRLIHRANEAAEELNDRMREVTRGAVSKLTQVQQLKNWIAEESGIVLDTLRKEEMEILLGNAPDMTGTVHDNRFPSHVTEALKIRQEGAKSSVSKLLAILERVSDDGRVHGAFMYHGASTGRYTSVGVQLQNLMRDTLKNFDEEILGLNDFSLTEIAKCVRSVFIPREGHVFVDADYSAIEARGVGWLAGCEKLLEIYHRGGDPYCEIAEDIYGKKVVKGRDDDERWVGKQTILGCGYGMGPPKFFDQCFKFGKLIPRDLAERAVGSYREEFHEIPTLWRDMEKAAVRAVMYPGEVYSTPNRLISFCFKDGYLRMALPSGRRLFYKRPFLRDTVTPWGTARKVLWFWGINPKTKQWAPEKTWGGTLTENAVQAIARDLLFRAMDRLEYDYNMPLVLSVHDQLVAEVPILGAEYAVADMQMVMEDLPPWARGFPVEAEPKITTRFGK